MAARLLSRRLKPWPGLLSRTTADAQLLPASCTHAASINTSGSSKTSTGILLANLEGRRTSNAPLLLGLVDHFQRQTPRVGFFQPIEGSPYSHAANKPDDATSQHIELMRAACGLKDTPADMIGVPRSEAIQAFAEGKLDDVLDRIYSRYAAYRAKHDIVVLEGVAAAKRRMSNYNELNARIAAALDVPALLVLDGEANSTPIELADAALIGRQDFEEANADVAGLMLNRVHTNDLPTFNQQVRDRVRSKGLLYAGAIPWDDLLSSVRLDEMKAAVGAQQLHGDARSLDSEVSTVVVGSQHVSELLEELDACQPRRPLVVCSRDRSDILLSLLSAHHSSKGPHIAGVLLAAGHGPGKVAERILQNSTQHSEMAPGVAVLLVDKPLYDVTTAISSIAPSILPTSTAKIDRARELFNRHIHLDSIEQKLKAPREAHMTPKMFMYTISQKCLENPQRIVLPESNDHRVLAAASEIARKKLANVTLLGNPDVVQAEANKLGLDLSGCNIHDHMNSPQLQKYVETLCEARKKKGLTPEQARDQLTDISMFGALMVRCGDADGMVSGATTTTANTIRPALQVLKDKPVSSVFFMCLPDKVLVYGDCAVNVDPSAYELAVIATSSADTAEAFGIEPRVAILSYSTGVSGSGPQVEKVKEAVKLAREMRPDLKLEGPIQYDAAVDPVVAKQKVKGHNEVAGRATVCIFPDLNTGNNTYKAVQQSTGAVAMGPILQGLAKPINDLSRGCTVLDIINTVACTSVQAQFMNKEQGK